MAKKTEKKVKKPAKKQKSDSDKNLKINGSFLDVINIAVNSKKGK